MNWLSICFVTSLFRIGCKPDGPGDHDASTNVDSTYPASSSENTYADARSTDPPSPGDRVFYSAPIWIRQLGSSDSVMLRHIIVNDARWVVAYDSRGNELDTFDPNDIYSIDTLKLINDSLAIVVDNRRGSSIRQNSHILAVKDNHFQYTLGLHTLDSFQWIDTEYRWYSVTNCCQYNDGQCIVGWSTGNAVEKDQPGLYPDCSA